MMAASGVGVLISTRDPCINAVLDIGEFTPEKIHEARCVSAFNARSVAQAHGFSRHWRNLLLTFCAPADVLQGEGELFPIIILF